MQRTLHLPLRVGIAPVKFVAKLAAEESGPGGVRRVAAEAVRASSSRFPSERLPGVGPHTLAVLGELGIATVGELAVARREAIEERLGNHGLALRAWREGRGRRACGPRPTPAASARRPPSRPASAISPSSRRSSASWREGSPPPSPASASAPAGSS